MHICFLTNEYPKKDIAHGGIGTFVKFLAKNLITKGFKISVLGIGNSFIDEVEVDNKIEIYRLKKSKWRFGRFYDHSIRLQKKIKEINALNQISIVEGSELSFAFFPKKTTYLKVIRLHGGHHFFALELGNKPALWRGYQEMKSFKKADYFIAVSNYVGKQTQNYLNYNFKYEVIHNSIDITNFKIQNNIQPINNTLLFIGTLCDKKGIENLILSLEIIKKDFPDIVLKIIGRDWLNEKGLSYKTFLLEIIKDKNLVQNICFLNVVSYKEIPSYIQQSSICIFPSKMESFGLVVIEAMSLAKPIVLSNIKPFKEIVIDKVSGLFCNPLLVEDIAIKILTFLNNKKYSKIVGDNAQKEFNLKFLPNKLTQQNINFYNNIFKNN